jgi:hypothetical protein
MSGSEKLNNIPTYPHKKISSQRMANKQYFNLGLRSKAIYE